MTRPARTTGRRATGAVSVLPARPAADRFTDRFTEPFPADRFTDPHAAGRFAGPRREPTALERLAAGEPVLLERVDLIAFANSDWPQLDPARDPADYTLAEVMLSWFHRHVGQDRRTKGDRAANLAVTLRRYLLPYALETGHLAGDARAAAFRVQHAETLVSILAGDQPLPAATVAGDLLGRFAAGCHWLDPDDAAQVSAGGAAAVRAATAAGRLPVHHTGDGRPAFAAADLRRAGLLREPVQPHGLDRDSANNHLRTLRDCLDRAADLGVPVTGNFDNVRAAAPLADRRQRPEPEPLNQAVGIAAVAAVCAHLSPVMQLALWLLRLTGMRIGEAYGLQVGDYSRDEHGRGWLHLTTQGGTECLVRDAHGKLRLSPTKAHLKTAQSQRTIPIPALLSRLIDEVIRVFHTDPVTGRVDPADRLVPGLRSDNDGGAAALRAALNTALDRVANQAATRGDTAGTPAAVEVFTPHDLRASLITDLYDAGVPERLAEWYTGHAFATTVHRGYDRGPAPDGWAPVLEATEGGCAAAGISELQVPTATQAQFGRRTRRGRHRDLIRAELTATGWLLPRGTRPPTRSPGTAPDPAPDTAPGTAATSALSGELPDGESQDGELLDSAGVAHRAGVAPGTARRWLRDGLIPARPAAWGTRQVLLARAADVEAFLARRTAGTTVRQLAEQTGWGYHQVFRLLDTLGIAATRPRHGAIALTAAQAETVRAEIARRAAAAQLAVPVAEAADQLGLTVLTVQALLRRGELEQAPTPDGTRHRYVTLASVHAYLARFPCDEQAAAAGQRLVPQGIARTALRLTRPQLRFLVTSRQLVARTPRRRMYLTLDSIERYAVGRSDLAAAVDHCRAKSRPA